MCLLVNFLCRKEEFINWLLMLNGVLMGKYNNSTGAKEKYRDITSILILGPQKSLGRGFYQAGCDGNTPATCNVKRWLGSPVESTWMFTLQGILTEDYEFFSPLEIAVCWQRVSWAGIPPGRHALELLFSGQGRQGSAAEEQKYFQDWTLSWKPEHPLLVWIEVKRIVEPVKNLHSRYVTDWSSASKQMLTVMYFWFWPLGWKFSV